MSSEKAARAVFIVLLLPVVPLAVYTKEERIAVAVHTRNHGFDAKEERRKWDNTFRGLRTIEANVFAYEARPVQYVAPINQARHFAMCSIGHTTRREHITVP